jgi:hypothetical protein
MTTSNLVWNNTTSTSTGTYIIPLTAAPGFVSPLPPRELTPLEWLDAEVDRTCALARRP